MVNHFLSICLTVAKIVVNWDCFQDIHRCLNDAWHWHHVVQICFLHAQPWLTCKLFYRWSIPWPIQSFLQDFICVRWGGTTSSLHNDQSNFLIQDSRLCPRISATTSSLQLHPQTFQNFFPVFFSAHFLWMVFFLSQFCLHLGANSD